MEPNLSDTSRTLWIGDLDSWMDDSYLQSLVNSLGYTKELTSIKLIKDKATGLPLKYGFLEFATHESAYNFYTNYNNRTIPNTSKLFKLNWAAYGGGSKTGTLNPSKNNQQEIQVYVGDLDPTVTEHKLLEFFKSRYPSAFNAKIITDTATKVSKGYGFVKFNSNEEAHRAISEVNGQALLGKSLKVSTAYLKSKEEAQVENEESESQLLLRQKLYTQFYSSINDPQFKTEYERQVLKTFGAEDAKKPTLKQSLEGVRSLSHA
jgi:RNA recognition motif-containing protein